MKEKKAKVFIYCLILGAIFVTICSRSSVLYVMNNWDDANCFFTIGKNMLRGKVLYKEIFDQKGPYLYLLYGLAYLISHTTFFGAYLFEIVSWAFSGYYAFRIIEMFAGKKLAYILTPLFAAGALSSDSFYWGGSAEEMFLPLLLLTLYLFLKEWKTDSEEPVSGKEIFVIGLCAGIWALVKYTLLFFFAIVMLLILLHRITEKDWKSVGRIIVQFLIGFVIAFLPWIVYFAVNGAMKDWFDGYILINMKYASGSKDRGIGEIIYNWVMTLYWDIYYNPLYFGWIALGMIGSVFVKRKHWFQRFDLWFLFVISFLGIYLSGTMLKYYAFPLCVFAPIGFGMFGGFLHKLIRKECNIAIVSACSVIFILFSSVLAFQVSDNTDFMREKDYYLFTFRDLIKESENPTLLNYGCLDAGLFTLCDIEPTMKWFHQQNANIPEMFEAQQSAIDNGLTEYVYARSDKYPANIEAHYELISEIQTDVTGVDFTYYLFRRK